MKAFISDTMASQPVVISEAVVEQHPGIVGENNASGTEGSQVQPINCDCLEMEIEQLQDEIQNKTKVLADKKAKLKDSKKHKNDNERGRMEQAKTHLDDFVQYKLAKGKSVKKRAAYIKNNRMISWKRVEEFIQIIRAHKYVADYPIIVANARTFQEANSDIEIRDAYGNEIPNEKLDDYYVYLDGQHRGQAHILLRALGETNEPIPGVVVKDDVADVADFLVSINPKGSWSNAQKAMVCALTVKGKYLDLVEAVGELVRKGFNRSTASQIFCGKPLTSKQYDILLAGKEPKSTISFNIQKGQEFIDACTKAGITTEFLTKRHFIEGYLDYKTETSEAIADKALTRLPMFDEKMLKGIKSKEGFKKILERTNND